MARTVAIVALALAVVPAARAQEPEGISVELTDVALVGVDHELTARVPAGRELDAEVGWRAEVSGAVIGRGTVVTRGEDGAALRAIELGTVRLSRAGAQTVVVRIGGEEVREPVRAIPGWLSLLPALVAIGLAIAFRQVVVALVSGVWLGALFLHGYDPLGALLRTADTYAAKSLGDVDNASIIVFSLLLGGMIGVITRSGGAAGLAGLVTKRASDSRRGQLATWALGVLVFFDDYANALLVGSTMRPITDRLRVSREKLAFVVDATAATVSSVAIVSSWIGVEIGYIAAQYQALGLEGDAFLVFLETIPYRFYPLLMIVFVVLVIVMRRDFGPMHRAEMRAREHGQVLSETARPAADHDGGHELPKTKKPHWIDAAVPIVTVVLVALGGMYLSGRSAVLEEGGEPTLREVFGNAESVKSLLWASLSGCLAAIGVSVARRSLGFAAALDAWLAGVKSMVLACIILVLAWSLGSVCGELHTARFVIGAIGEWLTPGLLPAIVFVVAAAVSFATGTSWGTMAILFPLVMPMAHTLAPGDEAIMLGGISSILAGSVWGDHCSPISDTTIMSSMASACDHIDHVRTQLPYALAVGLVGLVFGELATGLGLYPAWVGLVLGVAALAALLRWVGRPVPDGSPAGASGDGGDTDGG